jgi:DNA-binding NarL/FixJ family response regulator
MVTMARKQANARTRPARVLIVDDHPIVREGLALLISSQADLEVCGEAEDVITAGQLIDEARPDVAIVDISLKGSSGLELIKRIKAKHPSVQILVSSIHDESVYAERALRAGAMGYVNKQEATRTILVALRRILDGRVYLSERMADRLLCRTVGGGGEPIVGSPIESLSDRELEVFELIGQGLSTTEIAARLHLSSKTVETYRDRIRVKLNLTTGFQLARYALQWVLENA